MASVSAWIVSFRLHTLPLALSTTLMGSFLAANYYQFNVAVFFAVLLTTLFLQILSNLANDYGDAQSGVDNADRVGPQRSLQSGVITAKQMKKAIIIFVLLALVSGIYLIWIGTRGLTLGYGLWLLVLGIAAIIAAMKYTMGKNPYGYAGFGDVFVFLFFGFVGVLGTFFLHTHFVAAKECLPAVAMGCFSTGVLNLNNLRDRENDAACGKRTLVVKLGLKRAQYYHFVLLSIGMLAAVIYSFLAEASFFKWVYLVSFVGIIRSILVVFKNKDPKDLYPELKKLSISTLIFTLLFGLGLVV